MDSTKIANLDLPLAWQRIKRDRPDRAFFTHPHLFDWIELDLDGWFSGIRTRLKQGFAPHPSLTCSVPKPGWLVRPGTVLDVQDELVLNALVATLHTKAYALLGQFQGDPDIAYQLQRYGNVGEWLRTGFRIWAEWRNKSLQKLVGAQFVVFADIAGFYENIDLQRLRNDLNPLSIEPSFLDLLMTLLNRWAQPRGKGIPQGYSAADILAKIYLNPIDRGLRNNGFIHLRYVDDIRIFCRSRLEAKRGLLLLNELIRRRGLNLQSAKTKLMRADDALHEIDGVSPLIHSIQSEMLTELKETFSGIGSYISVGEIERKFESDPFAPAPAVLEQAFQDNFEHASEGFNKTLLHYLLTRLGKVRSRAAVAYSIELLQQRPDETSAALRYLSEIGVSVADEQIIIGYIASQEAIYDYQLFQIVAWFSSRGSYPTELIQQCRLWTFDKNRDLWLRTAARSVLAEAGDQSDLESIESSYESYTSELERADIINALTRMETGRRNSFFGRVTSDNELVTRAIRFVRASSRRETQVEL
jgi:hypothetical protein